MKNIIYTSRKKNKHFIRFKFLGWIDEATGEKYHNSIRELFDEMIAGRTEHKFDSSLMTVDYEGDNAPDGGTPKESDITVFYDDRKMTPEKIESFLSTIGLHIERANPFFFTPTLWDKVSGVLLIPLVAPLALFLLFITWIANRRVTKKS